jgi:hypothetical protein
MNVKLKIIGLMLAVLSVTEMQAQIIKPNAEEKLITERFEYIRIIKKHIGNLFWKNFFQ